MNRIRYKDGIIKIENRNHFTGLDWVPNNIQAGFLIDITSEIAGPHPTALTEALIEKSGWYAHLTADRIQGFTNQEVSQKLSSLHRMGSVFENQTEIVRYIKLDTIIENPEVLQLIPSGSVINVVRPNWDIKDKIGTNMNISHQGFVIQSSGRTLFRHASQTEKKVSEDNLLDYLKSMKSVPSIDGIQVLKVTE